MKYCDSCGRKFHIIYKSNVNCLKNDTSTGETIWKWFRRISEKLWIERYQTFVKNLSEVYKNKFKQKIRRLFDKFFICSGHCREAIQDKYW